MPLGVRVVEAFLLGVGEGVDQHQEVVAGVAVHHLVGVVGEEGVAHLQEEVGEEVVGAAHPQAVEEVEGEGGRQDP